MYMKYLRKVSEYPIQSLSIYPLHIHITNIVFHTVYIDTLIRACQYKIKIHIYIKWVAVAPSIQR
jgi:hypothetical protein